MKIESFAVATAVILMSVFKSDAQTNVAPIITTNWITAVPQFREVNGRLYNTEKSILFQDISCNCLKVLGDELLVETFTQEPIQQPVVHRHMNFAMGVPTGGYHDETEMVTTGWKEIPGPKIVVENYPSNLNAAEGQKLSFRSIKVGITNLNGNTLELWDYGNPHIVRVLTTNYVAQAKRLK